MAALDARRPARRDRPVSLHRQLAALWHEALTAPSPRVLEPGPGGEVATWFNGHLDQCRWLKSVGYRPQS